MRLLGLVPLLFVLAACGGNDEAGPAASPSSMVTPDSELAHAAENIANGSDGSSPTPAASELPSDGLSAPAIPTDDVQTTFNVKPSKYDVKAPLDDKSDDCDHIWQYRNVLPQPYNGCMDGAMIVAAEGQQRSDGVYYSYKKFCAREGSLIKYC